MPFTPSYLGLALGAVCWLLLAMAPPALRAAEIRNAAEAEALCSTAAFEPAEGTGLGHDPFIRTRLRHQYMLERQMRLTDIYSVTLDTAEFSFLPGEAGLLVVDGLNPFSLFGGAYALDLGSMDISFLADEAEYEQIQAGIASDSVLLRLTFHLASLDDPWSAYCQPSGSMTRILGRLLAAELVGRGDGEPILTAETERYRTGEVRFGVRIGMRYVPPQPRVEVTSTAFPDGTPPPEHAELLRMEAETRLMPCYIQGLSANGRLQGAVVIQSEVDADGHVQDAVVTIDAVDQEIVTGCAVGALREIALPGTGAGAGYEVRMTVIFRLE